MSVGEGGLRNEGAGAEEVPRGGDVVASLVPEVGQAEEAEVSEVHGDEEERVEHPKGDVTEGLPFFAAAGAWDSHALVDGAAGVWELLEGDGAEGLLVLGEVVPEDVPEGFGLLRADIDALEVADIEDVGIVLAHGAEDEEEVPDAHADLDAVGVSVAVIGGGGEGQSGLVF